MHNIRTNQIAGKIWKIKKQILSYLFTLDASILHFIPSILTTSPVSPNTSNPSNPTTLKAFIVSAFQVEITVIVNDCWHNTDPVIWYWDFVLDTEESEDIFVTIGCAHVSGLII